jgi:hypothetical protein
VGLGLSRYQTSHDVNRSPRATARQESAPLRAGLTRDPCLARSSSDRRHDPGRRATRSPVGPPITEWQPIMGRCRHRRTGWQHQAYQKIGIYRDQARHEPGKFKTIYWWEWAHRFLGRLIGAAFFVPFVVFWLAGFIPRTLLPN